MILRLFLASVVLLSQSALADETMVINKVTNASVLIKTQLLHGFTEDGEASGRWTGSGF